MAAWVMSISPGSFAEQRGIVHQEFVGFLAVTDPHLVGTLLVPYHRTFRAGQFVKQSIFATGEALRNGERTACTVVEFEQHVGVIFGVDLYRFIIRGLKHLAGVGLDFFFWLHPG